MTGTSGPCVRDMANPVYLAALDELARIRAGVRHGSDASGYAQALTNVAAIFDTWPSQVVTDLYARLGGFDAVYPLGAHLSLESEAHRG